MHIRHVTAVTILLLILTALNTAEINAQSLKAHINVISLSPVRVKVEGGRATETRVWSFRNAYAGLIGLGERIENLTLADVSGVNVPVRKLAPGEYQAASAAMRFSYEVNMEAPPQVAGAAYVSWLTGAHGFLMLGDLLPRLTNETEAIAHTSTVHITLPPNWSIATNEKQKADGSFEITDLERAVFFVGEQLRKKRARVSSMELDFIIAGNWAFIDEDAVDVAVKILQHYTEAFRGGLHRRAMLMLAPFPQRVDAARWSAETRGGTVMLLLGRSPSRVAGLAQLSVLLTHELFHLGVPNSLTLTGNYDWFYEGFTLYQAIRAGMRLHSLTFQDYLNAFGRAFDAYSSIPDRDMLSLVDASQRRWTGSSALIYQKGMLVAFLYDLRLRYQTKGKHSLDDVYRDLLRRHSAPAASKDGNAAVIAALNSVGKMQDFVSRYIGGTDVIDLQSAIAPFGLQLDRSGTRTRIFVSNSLSRAQRDLLHGFGYNE